MIKTPLPQETGARLAERVVKLPVSREEGIDSATHLPGERDHQAPHERPIGGILVDARRLRPDDVGRVLENAQHHRLRFGEAAVRMGLVKVEDVEFALARQFAFPYLNPNETAISRKIIAAHHPSHPLVEQFRILRAQLSARASDDLNARLVMAVVSSERGDGRSFTAANLAVVFAQLGRSTLLVDASFRTACLHRWFAVDNHAGLSSILARRSGLDRIEPITEVPALHVLSAGPVPPNPLELLEHSRFAELLFELGRRFEVVVIDTPAGSVGGDGPMLARRAGSAVIVARANETRSDRARAFAMKLEQARTRVLGVVFNERR